MGILGVVRVRVQHVTDPTETLVECVSLQDVCCVGSGEITVANYGCTRKGNDQGTGDPSL